jgi:hypothetical protein
MQRKNISRELFPKAESVISSDLSDLNSQKNQSEVDFSYPHKEMIVMPQVAEYFLKDNRCGRRLTDLKVKTLVRVLDEDRWKVTGDPIRLGHYNPETKCRPLFDGQHRLNAILRANKPARCVVIEDFPEELWSFIDGFKPRIAADLIGDKFDAHDTYRLASATRLVWYFERQLLPNRSSLPLDNDQILNTLERHNELLHWISIVVRGPLRTGAVVACAYWLMSTKDARAEKFVHDLTTAAPDMHLSDPLNILREKIKNLKFYRHRRKSGQAEQIDVVWMIFRTWRAHINAQVTRRIVLNYSLEDFPWPGGAPYLEKSK